MQTHYPLTIYYDGSCPLCTQEIGFLKARDTFDRLRAIDCSPLTFAAVDGHSREAMMQRIHARDASGNWLVGVPVFAAAYAASELGTLAAIWASSRLQPLWNRLYPWVAKHRRLLSRLGLRSVFQMAAYAVNHWAAWRSNHRSQRCAGKTKSSDGSDGSDSCKID